MKLQQVFNNVIWSDVADVLNEEYNYSSKSNNNFKSIFFDLLNRVPSDNVEGVEIVLHTETGYDDNEYVSVSGDVGEEYFRGIEFEPWESWLGYDISEDTLNSYSLSEIVAHCLYEMTFYGDEEDIKEQREWLEDKSLKIEKGHFVTYKEVCFLCEGTKIIDFEDGDTVKCPICDSSGEVSMFRTTGNGK